MRTRLDPAVFRLPVAADPGGLLHRRLLQPREGAAGGGGPAPAGHDAGVPEGRVGAGRDRRGDRRAEGVRRARGRRRLGAGLGPAGGARAARGRRDRAARDRDDDRGRLLAVRPPRDRLPRLPGPAHAGDAQRARGGGGRARQADPLLPGAPRPLAGADRRRLGRPRGGRDRRVHRRPGVVVGRHGHRHRAARADRGLRRRHGGGVEVVRPPLRARDERDRAGGLRERLGAHRARGGRRARRRPLGGAPGHLRADRGPRPVGRHGRLQAHRREPRAGGEGARGTRRRRPRARQDRVLRRLRRGQDPRVRGGRRAGGLLRRGLLAAARPERLHRRRGAGGRPRLRQGRAGIPRRTRGSSGWTDVRGARRGRSPLPWSAHVRPSHLLVPDPGLGSHLAADHLHGPDRGRAGLHAAVHAAHGAAGDQALELGLDRLGGRGRAWRRPRTSCARSWTSCATPSASARSAPRCRRASCCTARPAPARRCWPRRWRTSPTRSSTPSRRRRSWRCSPAWARPGSGGCSARRARTRRRSCSSTSWTPWAPRAATTSRARRTRRSTSSWWSWTASAAATSSW